MAKALDRATLRVIAERALDEWDICAVELELISISENTVFRVDTNTGETYVLRIHRPGYHNARGTELRATVDSSIETSGHRCAVTTVDA